MLNIEIDGKKIEVPEGSMVIEAADANGIYIPRFCYHRKLSVAANCRMCLVDVEKAPKPLPACATPCTEGMIVRTRSAKAVTAQKGVMEFLLINHPLDCPICDQGGECELQDLAVGYGGDVSRFQEKKRIVMDKYIGPLISTDMTRCIHCTRCVRFGQEIAGMMELGATGRGEHMRIGTYVERTVDSELSGNMIDLCPVGALTSRPFRYSARSWELQDRPSVSPHDCVGANLDVQVVRNRVKRVLPRENEAVNEVWLADRDRFSYEGLESDDRLLHPMIRENGQWRETDWPTALEFTRRGLRKLIADHGATQLGAIASPTCTVEEFYLLQKLMRGLGSGNVDHRLRHRDFSDDERVPVFPWLGQSIQDLETLDTVLLIGSNLRKDQPLLAHRLRKAYLHGAAIAAVNPIDYDLNFGLKEKIISSPDGMLRALARIAAALAKEVGRSLPDALRSWLGGAEPSASERAIAAMLKVGKQTGLLLGLQAQSHGRAADVRAIADWMAQAVNAKLGVLCEANGVGGWLAGCVPHRGALGATSERRGQHAFGMMYTPLRGYIVVGAEPEYDCWDGDLAQRALAQADFVVMLGTFQGQAAQTAHVMLPMAPFTETSGSFVNCEGRWQSFQAAVTPPADVRPGWKILRVLGNLFELGGFDYVRSEEIRDQLMAQPVAPSSRLSAWQLGAAPEAGSALTRIMEVPLYKVDPLVRRSAPLQMTRDTPKPTARMNAEELARLGLTAGNTIRLQVGGAAREEVRLTVNVDSRVPNGCVWVPAGYAETVRLGGHGLASINRA